MADPDPLIDGLPNTVWAIYSLMQPCGMHALQLHCPGLRVCDPQKAKAGWLK